ncbi:MAG: DNA polymerase III subunit delta [Candidatus Margulisiibacteriota bacterium]
MPSDKDNIYLFYGDEELMIDEEIRAVAAKHLGREFSELNFLVFDAKEIEEESFLPQIRAVSMFCPKKVVLLKGLGAKKTEEDDEEGGQAEDKAEKADIIIDALAGLPQDTVFIAAAKHIDKRSRLYKFLNQNGRVREFRRFAPWEHNELAAWVEKRLKDAGLEAPRDAVFLLAQISGPSLLQIDTEIKKLWAYCADKEALTVQDIKELASRGELSSFTLQNALQERDLKKALNALNVMLAAKVKTEMIIGSLGSIISLMLEIKAAGDAFKAAGRQSYYIERCIEGSKRYSLRELAAGVKIMHDTDLRLKTISPDPRVTLEMMLSDIIARNN